MSFKEEVAQETCSKCKYYKKEMGVCIAEPPTVLYHDVLKIRDKTGKIVETRAPNVINISPFVNEDRESCRFYCER